VALALVACGSFKDDEVPYTPTVTLTTTTTTVDATRGDDGT